MNARPALPLALVLTFATAAIAAPSEKAENAMQKPSAAPASVRPMDIVLVRTFDAPVEVVWRAFTDPDQVARWWGPKKYTSPFARIDLREGGAYVFAMLAPPEHGGREMYTSGVFGAIEPLKRLEFTQGLSDKDGKRVDPASLGMPPDFPDDIPTTVEFKPVAGKTTVTVVETNWFPGPMRDFSEAGMSECLDKLADTLPRR
jgi:uncharacterized protein YndB with AHSA1/START domain